MRTTVLTFALAAAIFGGVRADDLEVAKSALRDGLWDIARVHAAKAAPASGTDEARIIELESYARDGRWGDVLAALASRVEGLSEEEKYYRALAQYETGDDRAAADTLGATAFGRADLRNLAVLLRAMISVRGGDFAEALKTLKGVDIGEADSVMKAIAADIRAAAGDRKGAEALWREIAAMKTAGEREITIAAVNLEDAELLRGVIAAITDVKLRRVAGLRLARMLLEEPRTAVEGESIIRRIVGVDPDAEGAEEAYSALAASLLKRGRWQEAADAYRDLVAIWPRAAKLSDVQEGRGWAFRRLNRLEEALDAFSRAVESAANDESRATAMLAKGDVLSDLGRKADSLAVYREIAAGYPSTAAGEKIALQLKLIDLEESGRALYREYRFAEAYSVFAELATLDPAKKSKAELMEVLCLYGQRKDEEAENRARYLSDSATDETVRSEATLWLAKYEYNSSRWTDAAKLFSRYVDMRPEAADAPESMLWCSRAQLADNDFPGAIHTVTTLAESYPDSPEKSRGFLVQGEALIELSRFDEAVLVLERAAMDARSPAQDRLSASLLKADALFAMGADNPVRYEEALAEYRRVRESADLDRTLRLAVSFKLGRTLEKLRRVDEAVDQYYTDVVLAYRDAAATGRQLGDEARSAFARAAFRLSDIFESRGRPSQAVNILNLVVTSGLPAAVEAVRRRDRITQKGSSL